VISIAMPVGMGTHAGVNVADLFTQSLVKKTETVTGSHVDVNAAAQTTKRRRYKMDRRKFITGLIAAPAVIRIPGLLMPIKKIITPTNFWYETRRTDWNSTPFVPSVIAVAGRIYTLEEFLR
jgi:hypothetical protein